MDWPNSEIMRSRNALIMLRDLCENTFKENPASDVADELGKFLAIRSCGHIEITTTECVRSFINRHAPGMVGSYASGLYKTWMSPKYRNLCDVLDRFSVELSYELGKHLDADRNYVNDLGSLVNARDKIAHGQNEQVTVRKALSYCDSALYIADWYTSCFAPGGYADSIQAAAIESPAPSGK